MSIILRHLAKGPSEQSNKAVKECEPDPPKYHAASSGWAGLLTLKNASRVSCISCTVTAPSVIPTIRSAISGEGIRAPVIQSLTAAPVTPPITSAIFSPFMARSSMYDLRFMCDNKTNCLKNVKHIVCRPHNNLLRNCNDVE